MSGECDKCGEHCLECTCGKERTLQVAVAALNIALQTFSSLGYQPKENIQFVKKGYSNKSRKP